MHEQFSVDWKFVRFQCIFFSTYRWIKKTAKLFCGIMTEHGIIFEHNSDFIKNYLSRFTGGKVILSKNDKTGVATLCIDNSKKCNAFSGEMMVNFRNCIEELEKWEYGRAVILHGKNGNFCSGGDLELAKASGTPQEGFDISSWMHQTLTRLQKLPFIIVCLLEGFVLGGGAEVSIFSDYIIAADNLKFGFVHGKMGIVTAWGGTTRLVEKLGQQKAFELLITSKVISTEEALSIGLIDHIVSSSEALAETTKWLNFRIQHHHTIIQTFKNIIINTRNNSLEDSYCYERKKLALFWGGVLNKEALGKNIKHKD